MTPFFNFYS